ncbi:steroidogenic acute regulatory protein, mitochondrial isoform X2 [Tyto alba]|uniref:steroidogenic acute regulatory protein, mitochondrial isoform X2 n=1 Tax=Tyto alba TaxID=56313 RepID=UPI001C685980|nr:steroidogenic acute regulatory protein, mitochondrial isoform X2 [Tyto alba]
MPLQPPPGLELEGVGFARAVLVLANNGVSLCRGLVPGSGCSIWDNNGPSWFAVGGGLPANPGAVSPGWGAPARQRGCGGARGEAPCRRVSSQTLQTPFGTSSRLQGWELPAAPLGFQTLLIFPPSVCRRVGTGWTEPRRGESCGRDPEITPAATAGEQEHGCSRDFPVNIWEGDGAASGPTSMNTRCLFLRTVENSRPGEQRGPFLDGRIDCYPLLSAGDELRGGSRPGHPRSPCSRVRPRHRDLPPSTSPSRAGRLCPRLAAGAARARPRRGLAGLQRGAPARLRPRARRTRPAAPGRCVRSRVWPWPPGPPRRK